MTLQANSGAPEPSTQSPAEQFQAEFKERREAAVAKATGTLASADDDVGEVVEEDDAPPPKAKAAAASPAATDSSSPAKSATEPEEKTEREAPQPRYDSKSFGKWVTNNPEKAAELAAKVFKVQLGDKAEDWKKHFIAAENKRRRQTEGLEKAEAAVAAEKAEVTRMVNDTLGAVQPILDVVESFSKDDFPAIDLFIEQASGMSFNDYCARRLRGNSKETPAERAAKLKAEKLEKELAELKAGKAAPESVKGDAKAPKVSDKWLDSELPGDHAVRDLVGWQQKVQEVYQDSFDAETEEYDLSIEDAADRVFRAWEKKRMPAAAEPVKAKPRAKPVKRKPVDDEEDEDRTPARDLDDLSETPPDDPQDRMRWALARASKRR